LIALALSAVAHVAVVPLLRMPATARAPEPTPLSIARIDEHRNATPPPPMPTPVPPIPSAKPIAHHVSPHVAIALARPLHVVHTGADTHALQAARPTTGTIAGDPYGDTKTNDPTGSGPGSLATMPATLPTPIDPPSTALSTPACANPPHDAIVTNAVTPERPAIAQEQGAAGRTQVRVDLSPTGSVVSASVARSSGNTALDTAAVEAARQARYAPASDGCRAIGGSYLYTVDYTE
jgi:TonB family protein